MTFSIMVEFLIQALHAVCPYAECRHAECRYADCRGAMLKINNYVDLC
jgi:hypothetical protein